MTEVQMNLAGELDLIIFQYCKNAIIISYVTKYIKQGSISLTFFEQLLRVQIQTAQKRLTT